MKDIDERIALVQKQIESKTRAIAEVKKKKAADTWQLINEDELKAQWKI